MTRPRIWTPRHGVDSPPPSPAGISPKKKSPVGFHFFSNLLTKYSAPARSWSKNSPTVPQKWPGCLKSSRIGTAKVLWILKVSLLMILRCEISHFEYFWKMEARTRQNDDPVTSWTAHHGVSICSEIGERVWIQGWRFLLLFKKQKKTCYFYNTIKNIFFGKMQVFSRFPWKMGLFGGKTQKKVSGHKNRKMTYLILLM